MDLCKTGRVLQYKEAYGNSSQCALPSANPNKQGAASPDLKTNSHKQLRSANAIFNMRYAYDGVQGYSAPLRPANAAAPPALTPSSLRAPLN